MLAVPFKEEITLTSHEYREDNLGCVKHGHIYYTKSENVSAPGMKILGLSTKQTQINVLMP